MMTIEQVETIRQRLIEEFAPKPESIRQIALATLGWPYVFGAWGEQCTPSGRKKRARSDHPTIISKCPALNGKSCSDCQWGIGVRMYDCRGFTAWLLRQVGLDISGQGATSQYNNNSNWMIKGPISEMPDLVCCVFKDKNGTKEHTGMHVGGGSIIHCSVNVQTGKTTDKGWTHYAVPVGLYTEEELKQAGKVVVIVALKKGSRGTAVKALQEMLNKLGYNCGTADGIFGAKTEDAVREFQAKNGLTVDGIAGAKTQELLAIQSSIVKNEPENPSEPSDEYLPIQTNEALNRALNSLLNAVSSINDAIKILNDMGGESNG